MTTEARSSIERLQAWYAHMCDGEWEHQYGIKIDTLDNPGWSLVIDLTATPLEDATFPEVNLEESEETWIHCRVKNRCFEGFGGPGMLGRLLDTFLDWAEPREAAGQQPEAADEAGLRKQPRR
jgi:hypothetical protein